MDTAPAINKLMLRDVMLLLTQRLIEESPIKVTMIPNPHVTNGNNITFHPKSKGGPTKTKPKIIIAIKLSELDSKRSAPLPAQSPTLSPTKSAITAGFLGSSSGIFVSSFPTKSAPTSAAFV